MENLDEDKLTHIWPSLIDFLGIDGIKENHFADLVHLYIKKIGLICFQKMMTPNIKLTPF